MLDQNALSPPHFIDPKVYEYEPLLTQSASLYKHYLKRPTFITAYKYVFLYDYFHLAVRTTLPLFVLWNMKTQCVPYRKHITSPLQGPAG
jgi:hypothetical protein